MRFFKKLLLVSLMTVASTSNAGVGSGDFGIARVEVTETFFTVYSSSGPITHENCQDAGKVVFWRTDFPNGYETMLSAALAAYMGDKNVSMWLNGCKAGPWGQTLPKPTTIVVKDKL